MATPSLICTSSKECYDYHTYTHTRTHACTHTHTHTHAHAHTYTMHKNTVLYIFVAFTVNELPVLLALNTLELSAHLPVNTRGTTDACSYAYSLYSCMHTHRAVSVECLAVIIGSLYGYWTAF